MAAKFIKIPNIGHPATSGTERGLESVCLPAAGRKKIVKSERRSFSEKAKKLRISTLIKKWFFLGQHHSDDFEAKKGDLRLENIYVWSIFPDISMS